MTPFKKMCGIFCIFSSSLDTESLSKTHKVCKYYLKRRGPDHYSCHETELLNYQFLISASILWLQGKHLVQQPIVNENSVFVYNGDIFGGTILEEDRKQSGDTVLFLNKLENADNHSEALSEIQGPYAFLYLDKRSQKLYFGRDIFGRRCLLIGRVRDGLILTSVGTKDISCIELPAIGTFSYDLHLKKLTLTPWSVTNSNFLPKLKELESFLDCDIGIEEKLMKHTPKAFIEPSESDLKLIEQIKKATINEVFEILLNDVIFLNNVNYLHSLLEKAIQQRISTQPKFCKNCIAEAKFCNHVLTAVLFSGGLDCSILALLADKFTDAHRSIDLINVAFQKNENYETPDRRTGLESFEELKELRPDRLWNFVEVNVPLSELNKERETHIKHLIHPLNTILDDSLGCALWFASRGHIESYETTARVLLVGMGADELFGGYTRHRTALNRTGWRGLYETLNEDWQNISHRNLTRDDRVVSDHGRQLRTPYLDEDVVEFVRNLNCWQKTCPSRDLPMGLGDKILLRTLAYSLGLKRVSTFKKRALQFGSRIANSKENALDVSPRL